MPSRQGLQRLRAALDAQRELLGEPVVPEETPADDTAHLRRACAAAVLRGLERGLDPHPDALRAAVRSFLDRLAAAAPGRSVEVRVPPYGAVQCVAGLRHARGTPPSVVETDPRTWVDLAAGRVGWQAAVTAGRVHASGERSDLSPYLPLDAG